MSFSLEEFKAYLNYGIARPHSYNVLISSPDRGLSKEIGLFAEEAEIPGKQMATGNQTLYGPSFKFPYQEIYADLRITFICSSDMWERKWFEEWQRKIVNPKSGFFSYYKDYVQDLVIQQLSSINTVEYEAVAMEAWPLSIDSQPLAYKDQNSYHRLTVTFAYRRFMETYIARFNSGDSGIPSGGPTRPGGGGGGSLRHRIGRDGHKSPASSSQQSPLSDFSSRCPTWIPVEPISINWTVAPLGV